MTQSIKQPWGLSVFGAGTVFAEPRLARVNLTVDKLAARPEDAFREAGEAVSALRRALREHGIADTSVSGSRLALASAHDGYGDKRRFLGYRCTARYTVETTSLDTLQQLVVDAVSAGANHVDRVVFDVEGKPALRDEARRRAVAAARRKAEVYAEATGAPLGPVIHIEDVDPEELSRGYRGHGSDAAEGLEGDLAPGMVEVTAAVLLGFSLGR
ncbi:SIMPL domain-containing protein [Streptomyces sp. NPDC045431]|uniref:SIMPL domain-containing protein n=1 Tax=Streptomyces sp. NPDC045431 TaxID=3155613 RepID=UPI0033D24E48